MTRDPAAARPELVQVGPGRSARVQATALQLARALAQPVRHRGLGRTVDAVGRRFSQDNYGVFALPGGGRLKVRLWDGYWLRVLLSGRPYEPEVEAFLRMLLVPGCVFVDCGANIGWWSVFASERSPGPAQIIAVEASATTFGMLRENAAMNRGAFDTVHAALWSSPGKRLVLREAAGQHAWASVDTDVQQDLALHRFSDDIVETTTIDELLESRVDGAATMVIKLDVEGAEIEALKGAYRALDHGAAVVYEDHGRDGQARVSQFVLEELGLKVLHLTQGPAVPMPNIEAVRELKKDRGRGYNFAALHPGPTLDRLLMS